MKNKSRQIALLQEKISGLTPLQRALIGLSSLVLFAAVFYFLEYKPQSEEIQRLRNEVASQERRLASLKQAAAQVDVLQKELEQAEEEFAHMLTLLPDQKEIPALLENISQLGAEAGLENILFQPQAEQVREFYAAIPIRLDLLGTYHEVGAFFDKISKLNRILKVDNLTMARQQDGSLLHVGCSIITYRFLEKPAKDTSPKK